MSAPEAQPEAQDDGQKKENIIAELVKLLLEALLRRRAKEVTELAFDEGGVFGKKIAEIKDLVNKAQERVEDSPEEAENILQQVRALFEPLDAQIKDYRQKRDEAVREGADAENAQSLVEIVTGLEQDSDNDEEREGYQQARGSLQQDQISKVREGVEEAVGSEDEDINEERVKELSKEAADLVKDGLEMAGLDAGVEQKLRTIKKEVGGIESTHGLKESGIGEVYGPSAGEKFGALQESISALERVPIGMDHIRAEIIRRSEGELVDALVRGQINQREFESLLGMLAKSRERYYYPETQAALAQRQQAREQLARQRENVALQLARGEITKDQAKQRYEALERRERVSRPELAREAEAMERWAQNLAERRAGRPGYYGDIPPEQLMEEEWRRMAEAMGEEPGEEFAGRGFYGPDYWYDQAVTKLRNQLGLGRDGELTEDHYREFVQHSVEEITRIGHGSYTQQKENMITELLANDLARHDFGISIEEQSEIAGQVEGMLKFNAFGRAYERSGSREEAASMSVRMKMNYESIIEMLKFKGKYALRYGRAERGGEHLAEEAARVELGVGPLSDLIFHYDYWTSDRAKEQGRNILSNDEAQRVRAKKDMVAYVLASQLDAWDDLGLERALINAKTGLVDFSKLKVTDGADGIRVGVAGVDGQVVLKGFELPNGELRGRQGREIDYLWGQTLGYATVAENLEHVTQEMHVHDPTFDQTNHRVNYFDRKYTDEMYALMYGVAKYPDMFKDLYPYLGGLYSRNWDKFTGETFNQVLKDNQGIAGGVGERDFRDLLQMLFKNRRRQLMSKDTLLTNFDDLFINRRVQGGRPGKEKHRWKSQLTDTDIRELEAVAHKTIDNQNFDWSAAIRKFGGEEALRAAGSHTTGYKGMKTFIRHMNREALLGTNIYEAEFQKHFDYSARLEKSMSNLFAEAGVPDYEGLIELGKSGLYDSYTNRERAAIMIRANEWMNKIQANQLGRIEHIKTDKQGAAVQMGLDAEGTPVYETQFTWFDNLGAERLFPTKPYWIRQNEINQLLARGFVDRQEYTRMLEDQLEGPFGYKIGGREIRLYGFAPFQWRFMRWTHYVPGLNSLKYMRIGPGPLYRAIRVWLSYVNRQEYIVETLFESLGAIGATAKSATEVA